MPKADEKPPQPDELHNYWCPKCKTWQMFKFEDWDMCDECAMVEALSDPINLV